jgi:tetratricopeptide (TPR) repeat protein
MDLTIVFSSDRVTPAKREAIEIAHRNGAEDKNGMFKIKFDKRCKDLTELIDLCESWKLSHALIQTKKYTVPEVSEVLYCENRRKCNGRCEHGFSDYIFLIESIGECAEDPEDKDIDVEWLMESVSDLDSFKKQPDGSFRIDKDHLKKAIENSFVIPMNVCDKFNISAIHEMIDDLPNGFSIPEVKGGRKSGSSVLDDDQREKIIETAHLVAPIYAKAVAREIENVIITNFGKENTAADLHKKAIAYDSLNRYKESLEYFNKALEMEPTSIQIWFDKGLLQEINLNDFKGAIDSFNRVLELDPAKIWSLYEIGSCHESLGNKDEAKRLYTKAIGLYEKRLADNPDDEEAKEDIGMIKENLSALDE